MAKKERNKITPRQEKLAVALSQSENVSSRETAGRLLGYQPRDLNPTVATPEVARAIKAGLVRRLIADAVPASMTLLQRAVRAGNEAYEKGEQATTAQLDAAKALMGFGGMQAAGESLSIEKDPGEMSGAELEEALRKAKDLEAEAARRGAIVVEGRVSAPDDAPVNSQAIDEKGSLFS